MNMESLKRQIAIARLARTVSRNAKAIASLGGSGSNFVYYSDGVNEGCQITTYQVGIVEPNVYKRVSREYRVEPLTRLLREHSGDIPLADIELLFGDYLVNEMVEYVDAKNKPVDYVPQATSKKAI